jgi:hypothetical protein
MVCYDAARQMLYRACTSSNFNNTSRVSTLQESASVVLHTNWMAHNFAHDVALPGAKGGPVGFLMYPQAETADGRLDSLDPDNFKYEIQAQESRPRMDDKCELLPKRRCRLDFG